MLSLIWVVFLILLVLWIIGFAVNWGAFIWILLILAIIALIFGIFTGGRSGRWY